MDNPLGFLSDMFGGGAAAPPSTDPQIGPPDPHAPPPAPPTDTTMASAQQPNPNSPTFKGFLGALNAGVNPNALQMPQVKPPAPPQIALPQPQQHNPQAMAQALAAIMAKLKMGQQPQQGMPQQ